jgi:hypothetical protein
VDGKLLGGIGAKMRIKAMMTIFREWGTLSS